MNGSSIFVSVGKSKEKGRINKNVIQFLEREGSKRQGSMLRVTSDATYTKNYSSIFKIESKSHKAKGSQILRLVQQMRKKVDCREDGSILESDSCFAY